MRYAAVVVARVQASLLQGRRSLARWRVALPLDRSLLSGALPTRARAWQGRGRRLAAGVAAMLLVALAIGAGGLLTAPPATGITGPTSGPRVVVEGLAERADAAAVSMPSGSAPGSTPGLTESPYAGAPLVAASPEGASGGSALLRRYVVVAGDSLWTVARRYELSFMTLVWANGLTDPTVLHVGQQLVIPPVDGLIYTALPGDTLDAVAAAHGITSASIMDASGLASPVLSVGELLILPGAQGAPLPTPAPTPRPTATKAPARTAAPVRAAKPATVTPARAGIGASRTYNSFAPGYCTWGAAYMLHSAIGVYPGWSGNAGQWATNAARVGWRVQSTPALRSIVVFPAWDQGAGSLGHVAWVTSINWSSRTFVVREMNGTAGWNRWDSRTVRFDSRLRFILS